MIAIMSNKTAREAERERDWETMRSLNSEKMKSPTIGTFLILYIWISILMCLSISVKSRIIKSGKGKHFPAK